MMINQYLSIQTNIFETNLINLAIFNEIIVIIIIIFFLGSSIKLTLMKRQKLIASNLRSANLRVIRSEKELEKAYQRCSEIDEKIAEIKVETKIIIKEQEKKLRAEHKAEIKFLHDSKNETILIQKNRVRQQIIKETLDTIFKNVYKRLEKILSPKNQKIINRFYINLLKSL
uniref:ATP synthase CF0 subunit I n=1 Tax=Callipsygma wilsonis TaxID=2320807 RepID=A0A386AZW9_9CHLO|nr:ATP synthase CF0 subunit I [Callipsygma wilsonis]AYC64998.1 ATP synthase CF0 subunit I [Callipsygma wilsonis]